MMDRGKSERLFFILASNKPMLQLTSEKIAYYILINNWPRPILIGKYKCG